MLLLVFLVLIQNHSKLPVLYHTDTILQPSSPSETKAEGCCFLWNLHNWRNQTAAMIMRQTACKDCWIVKTMLVQLNHFFSPASPRKCWHHLHKWSAESQGKPFSMFEIGKNQKLCPPAPVSRMFFSSCRWVWALNINLGCMMYILLPLTSLKCHGSEHNSTFETKRLELSNHASGPHKVRIPHLFDLVHLGRVWRNIGRNGIVESVACYWFKTLQHHCCQETAVPEVEASSIWRHIDAITAALPVPFASWNRMFPRWM